MRLTEAPQNNAARIAMSVEKAAKSLILRGQVADGILNKIEMASRAYDPCHGCATGATAGGRRWSFGSGIPPPASRSAESAKL